MSGVFEVFMDVDGKFRFRLRASNGEVIASSDGYTSWAGAASGIESVRATAVTAVVDDQTMLNHFDGRSDRGSGDSADRPCSSAASSSNDA